jgi:hypothetical protein
MPPFLVFLNEFFKKRKNQQKNAFCLDWNTYTPTAFRKQLPSVEVNGVGSMKCWSKNSFNQTFKKSKIIKKL